MQSDVYAGFHPKSVTNSKSAGAISREKFKFCLLSEIMSPSGDRADVSFAVHGVRSSMGVGAESNVQKE
jgi:hypothetical protein